MPADSTMTALLEAVAQGDGQAVAQILTTSAQQAGSAAAALATTDASGATALHVAVSLGNADIVQQLIQAGTAVDAQDQRWDRPLHVAGEDSVARLGPPVTARAFVHTIGIHTGTCVTLIPQQFHNNRASCHMVSSCCV